MKSDNPLAQHPRTSEGLPCDCRACERYHRFVKRFGNVYNDPEALAKREADNALMRRWMLELGPDKPRYDDDDRTVEYVPQEPPLGVENYLKTPTP